MLQKKTVRIMVGVKLQNSCRELFKRLHHLRCNFLFSLIFICTLVLILQYYMFQLDAIIRYLVFS
jgi:hypothetical protein